MVINNKFLRFLLSLLTALILYVLVGIVVIDDIFSEVLIILLLFLLWGFYISAPSLFFAVYTIYFFLTPKEVRSKKAITVFLLMVAFIIGVTLFFINQHQKYGY